MRQPDLKDRHQGSAAAENCIGDTDSELAFLLLLERFAALSPTASADERFDLCIGFCAQMRRFGDANFLYAEGERLYVHATNAATRRTARLGHRVRRAFISGSWSRQRPIGGLKALIWRVMVGTAY